MECVLGVNEVVCGGDAEVERESNFLPPGFFKLLCFFFQRGDRLHHPGGEDTIWGMYFVSLLTKNHIGNLVSETINSTGSLPFDIFHRPTNV